jgi:putative transcriptional regulator
MRPAEPTGQPLAGQLLVAHPSLQDPHFRKSIVFIAAHEPQDGALGYILNRHLSTTLNEVTTDVDAFFEALPLHEGGPVKPEELTLSGWSYDAKGFLSQLFFGFDAESAQQWVNSGEQNRQLKGFLGHSGWSAGQLEAELEEGAWLVCSVAEVDLKAVTEAGFWRNCLMKLRPELLLLADAPSDASRN